MRAERCIAPLATNPSASAAMLLGFIVFLGTVGPGIEPAYGQGLLDRLEDRIRQRVGIPPEATPPPAAPNPGNRLSLGMEAEEHGRSAPFEVIVISVRPQSPAANAGLVAGDIIAAVDGRAIGTIDEIAAAVSSKRAGDSMTLQVLRKGQTVDLQANFAAVMLGSPVNDEGGQPTVERSRPGSGRLGVTVENATTTAPGPGVPVKRGAVVVAVSADSPAAKAGIQTGNVIVAIDGIVIQEAASLIETISGTLPGQIIEVKYYRGDTLQNAKITLAAPAGATAAIAPRDTTNLPASSPEMIESPAAGLPSTGLSGGDSNRNPPSLALPPPIETGAPITPALGAAASGAAASDTPAPASAASTDTAESLRAEIQLLRKQLETLEKRLSELER